MPILVEYVRHFNSPPETVVASAEAATAGGTAYNPTISTAGAPTAPTGPFTAGTQVGVPTGTSLTTRTSLGSATGSTSYTITHPISGAQNTQTRATWQGINFTSTFTLNPTGGTRYLIKNCLFDVDDTSWVVEISDTNGVADQMDPLVVFENCSFRSNGNSSIGVAGSHIWLISCDIEGMPTASPAAGAADGWQGAAYSVAINSNIVAGTRTSEPDPHSDGMQNAGTGHTTLYHCWCSAGASAGANAAIRFGSEFGQVAAVEVYFCGLDDGGYAMQMDGSKSGNAGVVGVKVRGCRWTTTAVYGPTDLTNCTVTEWTDNAFFAGTVIPNPAP